MTPEQRLQFIQAVEKAGYTVEAEDLRGVLIVSIRDAHGYVVRCMNTRRFDFEQAARDFDAFQQRGSKRHTSRKAIAA